MDKNDLISRSALLERAIRVEGYLHLSDDRTKRIECIPVSFIEDSPVVDPENLRPKGRWKVDKSHNGEPYCSHCEFEPIAGDQSNYCPSCGAKMEG